MTTQCGTRLIGATGLAALCLCANAMAATLVQDGRPVATIVTAEDCTPAARLAARELQHHVEQITGATLPITATAGGTTGTRILVGESEATWELGLRGDDFGPQEYLIRVTDDTVVLMGRDWQDTEANRAEQGCDTHLRSLDSWRKTIDYNAAVGNDEGEPLQIELPGVLDDQGTCYATYDFLERFCGVRWYGPTPLNVVMPTQESLSVDTVELRRTPSLLHRHGAGGGWPIIKAQWNDPTAEQTSLYYRRLRFGGERWAGNHSFSDFQARFLKEDPNKPELWERAEPDFFAVGFEGDGSWRQLCLTNPKLVEQVAQDARDFFEGKGKTPMQPASGDYFAIVPGDNNNWCQCANCQAILEQGKDRDTGFFGTATASDYVFGFVNAVAREVAKTHPDKYITALAYFTYSFPPSFDLEPNVDIAPCMHICYGYDRGVYANDWDFYRQWVATGRRLHLWNYFHHPMEPAIIQGWKCFPAFMPDIIAREVRGYAQDGVRGFFLCGIGQQLDYYLYMKLGFDAEIDHQALIDGFFADYFGAAAEPMRRFYYRIAEINREEGVVGTTREKSWLQLGTEERMEELGALMAEAVELAETDVEKARVETWRVGVWEYMRQGREEFLAEASDRAPHASLAPGYIDDIFVSASWSGDRPSHTLVGGREMLESTDGVLGTRDALLISTGDADRHWMAHGPDGAWVEFNLMAPHRVDEIRIWNYKQNVGYGLNQRGMRQIRVEYRDAPDADWTLLTQLELPKADDREPSPVNAVISADGKVMRFVRITAEGGVGEGNWFEPEEERTGVGLGQVRFYGSGVE